MKVYVFSNLKDKSRDAFAKFKPLLEEYDMEMLKDKTDYYNMILANKYNEYCLEGLE
jgi:hypothetical protein